jgi:ubiquinone biosynthesis monooxygenase Coq7
MIDELITEFDKGLRTVFARAHSVRAHPDHQLAEAELTPAQKRHAAALMRVNHTGEVCAQALYNGQALSATNAQVAASMQQASKEETEHLAWCEKRIQELGGRTSVLNPFWYAGSFALGALAGAIGDKWSLGFLAETEHQVGRHLQSHLARLPQSDEKSRAIVKQMQQDEAQHAASAIQQGAAVLPVLVQKLMQVSAKVMTQTTYYL